MSSAVAERIAQLGPKQRALLEFRLGLREGDGSTTDRRLIAYVVPKKGADASMAELRRFAERELPAYMVPSVFVILDSAPLTAGGKLDRAALPAPQSTRPELDEAYVAPRTAMERGISALWQEVVGIDKVGLHDNFFDLGGHSLLLVRLQSRLQAVLGMHVAIIDLVRPVPLPDRQFARPPSQPGLGAGQSPGAGTATRRQTERAAGEKASAKT
jgi:hypothetical protein